MTGELRVRSFDNGHHCFSSGIARSPAFESDQRNDTMALAFVPLDEAMLLP